jgi:cytochrome b561
MARFIAMIMMVQGHVIDALANPIYTPTNEFPWNLWHFARGFTAQVFLMIRILIQVKEQVNEVLSLEERKA